MSYQKSYKKQSANQILKNAEISIMQYGDVEITHPDWPGCIFTKDLDGDLIISDYEGIIVRLLCSKRAADKLQNLADQANKKCIEILKKQDEENGTCWAENL